MVFIKQSRDLFLSHHIFSTRFNSLLELIKYIFYLWYLVVKFQRLYQNLFLQYAENQRNFRKFQRIQRNLKISRKSQKILGTITKYQKNSRKPYKILENVVENEYWVYYNILMFHFLPTTGATFLTMQQTTLSAKKKFKKFSENFQFL